jgi:hypothetical protein
MRSWRLGGDRGQGGSEEGDDSDPWGPPVSDGQEKKRERGYRFG